MDQFWLQLAVTVLIGGIGIYYQREQLRMMDSTKANAGRRLTLRKYWPIVLMLALAVSVWIPSVTDAGIREWSPGEDSPVLSYSNIPLGCEIVVNGDLFWKYRNKYKLASLCLYNDPTTDVLDITHFGISSLHEIRKGPITLRLNWGQSFLSYLADVRPNGLTHMVLMLPIGVHPGEVLSIRQARKALGAKVILGGSSVTDHPIIMRYPKNQPIPSPMQPLQQQR